MKEFDWIERYLKPLIQKDGGALELSDDGAVWGNHIVVTDSLHETIHFLSDDEKSDVSRLLLRVNLSDCAAMGAVPLHYWLNVGLPPCDAEAWMRGLGEGLARDQKKYGVSLMGGDSCSVRRDVSLSATLVGRITEHGIMKRSGVCIGDIIAVTGTLGDGGLAWLVALGKAQCDKKDEDFFYKKRLLPEPPVFLASSLAEMAHGAVDVSDGLLADVGHLAQASHVAIRIEIASLPLSAPLQRAVPLKKARQLALAGGGDYQLVVALAQNDWQRAQQSAQNHGVDLTIIGVATKGQGVTALDESGEAVQLPNFQHF